ncbi:MAG: hypothetical protein IRY99_26405, partial [Isosphaeraceae bacterium]|nr:hypothetical protein [Isosphaeraceae bacterium]
MHLRSRSLFCAVVWLVALMGATPARAAFEMIVRVPSLADIVILDNGPLDTNPDPSIITVNTQLLNLALGGPSALFQFNTLGAQSNRLVGMASQMATLQQTGAVARTTAGSGAQTVTITAVDTSYQFPNPPLVMNTSASDTYTFIPTSPANTRTFQSFFDASNMGVNAMNNPVGIPSTLLSFTAPPGMGPNSTSGTAPPTLLPGNPPPYALANQTVITQGP